MKQIIALALSALCMSSSVHAEVDLEGLYKSFIPKSSECYSVKLKNSNAAACHASCGEAVVNLRLLVNGIPQPLPEKVKEQIAKCESDYVAFKGAASDSQESEKDNVLEKPKVLATAEASKIENQNVSERYAELKDELTALGQTCSDADKSRHTKICVKF